MTAKPTLAEKMAQAMFERTHDQPWDEAIGDPGSAAGIYLDDARAALAVMLEAMREPSATAVNLGLYYSASHPSQKDLLLAGWRAMLAQFEREQAGG